MKEDGDMNPAALSALLDGDLGNFLVAATPGGIEAQEKSGQASFVAGSTLPLDMGRDGRERLERMGVVFGEPVGDLFIYAKLPDGWKKVPTEHSMWSDLLDDKGHKRAAIFYKAAFYDRSANLHLNTRYNTYHYQPCDEHGELVQLGQHTHCQVGVSSYGNPIHIVGHYDRTDYKESDRLVQVAIDWLNEHYPDWRDPVAYWD